MSDIDVLAILNCESGTLKTADPDGIGNLLVSTFAETGREVEVKFFRKGDFADFLEKSIASTTAKTIVVAGGDGTVSAAAGLCIEADLTLGILPAGTMNLYARTLNLPLDIETAARGLATGAVTRSDVGLANGRPFLHQYSVGLQPKVIKERDRASHRSRFTKLFAGIRAILSVIRRPPSFKVITDRDGVVREQLLSFIAVSNNLYGEGHLPYADEIDGGILGVYSAGRLGPRESLKLVADLTLGSWSANPDFQMNSAKKVLLKFPHRKRTAKAVVDGELIPLEDHVEIDIWPGALKVLRPALI